MKQSNVSKYSYAAGFFDGEGCIRITKRNPRNGRSTNYSLLVTVAQKDGQSMDWLYGNFGGMVYMKNKKKDESDWVYEWRLTDRKAYEFLKKILPFIIVKKAQARLAIRFQERRNFARTRHYPDNGRFAPLTKNELDTREKLYRRMCELKREYKKSKNPNVVKYNFKSMMQP